MSSPERQPHAVLDLPSRTKKGLKIERLLRLEKFPQPIRLLEVGTGSGGIAHYFGTHPTLRCDVTAVDVVDQRGVTDGFDFRIVDSTTLPFPSGSFDVVLTNHVIEHVGSRDAQLQHLREVHRVMKPRGLGYLAVPNRWMLVEPHFRLPFLSWLPRPLRSPYLRLMRRGNRYDCEPLRLTELDALLAEARFRVYHLETEAIRETVRIERIHGVAARIAVTLPDSVLAAMRRWIPTFICKLERFN